MEPKDLNFMLQKANARAEGEIADARVVYAKKLIESYGPARLAKEIQGVEQEINALGFVALLSAWNSDSNAIKTCVMTAFCLGRDMGRLDAASVGKVRTNDASQSINDSGAEQSVERLPRVRENE